MKSKTMKMVSLLMAGGMMLQFGGCFGDFLRITAFNVPVGAGRALGAIPANLINALVAPLVAPLNAAVGA